MAPSDDTDGTTSSKPDTPDTDGRHRRPKNKSDTTLIDARHRRDDLHWARTTPGPVKGRFFVTMRISG